MFPRPVMNKRQSLTRDVTAILKEPGVVSALNLQKAYTMRFGRAPRCLHATIPGNALKTEAKRDFKKSCGFAD